jgi:membrane-associated protease RseP (regulator of RpoE activity)
MRTIAGTILLAGLVFGTLLGSCPAQADPPSVSKKQAKVMSRLGISWTLYYVVNPLFALKRDFKEPHQGWGLLPGHPVQDNAIPTGWIVWVEKDSPLYKAGFRTGDVLTGVGKKEYLPMDEDLSDLLESNMAKEGQLLLKIRHFRDGFWRKEKPCAEKDRRPIGDQLRHPRPQPPEEPWYNDREVILLRC